MVLRPVRERRTCSFEDCDRPVKGHGLCGAHLRQKQYGKELTPIRIERTHRLVTAAGYHKVFDPHHVNAQKAGWVLEHVKVMSDHMHRRIDTSCETVHHVNGIKHDNRLENLELWSSRHPKGQRVEDLVAFANQILAVYGSD